VKALASVTVYGCSWATTTNNGASAIDADQMGAGVDTAIKALQGGSDALWLALTTGIHTHGTSGPGGVRVGRAMASTPAPLDL